MDKKNTIIIDDESDGRNTLKYFLNKYCPYIEVAGEAESIDEGVVQINNLAPQLVFLDINMPDEDGFTLFSRIPDPSFYIIFVTAYDEFALKAIKHRAFDYILKPINIDELIAAVHKVKKDIGHRNENSSSPSHAALSKIILDDKLALPIADGLVYVNIQTIIRCEAEANYTAFYFTNRPKILVSRTLGTYEEYLKPYGFIRVHHSHLVNKLFVEKYLRGRGGIIIMSDKKEIVVAQRKKADLLKFFGNLFPPPGK